MNENIKMDITKGRIRNVKYGTTIDGRKAVRFEIGSDALVSYRDEEPDLRTTWNKACAEVNESVPTDLKEGDAVILAGHWFALNNNLELGGTAFFAITISRD